MKMRRFICLLTAVVIILSGFSHEALADRRGRGRRGRHHSEFIHQRSHDYRFYHFPRKRYYVFKGYYYYYPRKYYCTYDYTAYRQNRDYLPITVIADMAVRGVPDEVIIEEIKRTRSAYELSSEVIAYLKDNRVSDKVIDYMLQTAKTGY